MRGKRSALITLLLLAGLIVAGGLWWRPEQRQYALNRQLIAALVKFDNKQALALVQAGADPNTHYKSTPSPSLLQLVKQFLRLSPLPANRSQTALALVCGAGWIDDITFMAQKRHPDDAPLVEAMLRHGATVNVKDKFGMTPLLRCVVSRRPKSLRLLLEHGASVNDQNENGVTALIMAATDYSPDRVLRLLLEYGPNANAHDRSGRTALHWAVWGDRVDPDVIRQLLAHGADPNLADKHGDTPLMLAQQKEDVAIIALLKQAVARK